MESGCKKGSERITFNPDISEFIMEQQGSEQRMRHSIKRQFAFIFIGLMAGTIGLCLLINNVFLEKFYTKYKLSILVNAYENINSAASNGSIDSDEFDLKLQQICEANNIAVIVLDADSQTIKSSSRNDEMMTKRLLDNFFREHNPKEMIKNTEKYAMKSTMDPMNHVEYIEMWGVLDNGTLFMIRTALEGIRDSVKIASIFLTYVGVLSTILSAVIIWMVSDRITRPILQLTQISERMTKLDFEAKYDGKDKNEIDLLGEHINQLSSTLEQTISELKTANNELKKDIEKKEQIDEMRKEFLSNVSHELKTPIALIQGYAEGLKEGISSDKESRDFYCDVIVDESSKMNNMVKKLLNLNQLEFGNDIVTMERFDIVALIQNFIQSADILIRQNEAKVIMEQTEPIYVWADEYKTEEVFQNYFSNALNHLDGERIIEVQIKPLEGKHKVRISVFNTGDTIPEESIPCIWDKFYKVDKARTREYGGSGVGLSIVKAIMESMNQSYGVRNYQNGVMFWFDLETT